MNNPTQKTIRNIYNSDILKLSQYYTTVMIGKTVFEIGKRSIELMKIKKSNNINIILSVFTTL